MAREKTRTKRKVSKNIAAGVAHVNSNEKEEHTWHVSPA